jgi:hypothetical protein
VKASTVSWMKSSDLRDTLLIKLRGLSLFPQLKSVKMYLIPSKEIGAAVCGFFFYFHFSDEDLLLIIKVVAQLKGGFL